MNKKTIKKIFIYCGSMHVIVEEDLEAYLNGALVFHPLGEVFE